MIDVECSGMNNQHFDLDHLIKHVERVEYNVTIYWVSHHDRFLWKQVSAISYMPAVGNGFTRTR